MRPDRKRDRAIGAYLGAAIGDAMGGPVECQHAARIRRVHGEITGLMAYRNMIESAKTNAPRTPETLARWLLGNAEFRMWWRPAVESGLPAEWVAAVCEANRRDLDVRGLAAEVLDPRR